MRFLVPSFFAALCGVAAAQVRTLPVGYQDRSGEWASGTGVNYPFDTSPSFEYQEVHSDWTGTNVATLNAISFRRAPNRVANTTAIGHTLDATVTLGAGDLHAFTATFATNYVGLPTVVLARRTVNMPDWTHQSVPPEVFSVVLPFDAPYTVDTQHDFIWQFLVQDSTLPNVGTSLYYSDRTASRTATPVVVGTGCTATGRTAPMTLAMSFTNTGTAMSLSFSGSNYPASVPVVLHVGLANLNLRYPGLCGNIYARPDLMLAAGSTSFAGALAPQTVPLPFRRAFRNLSLVTQALAPDVDQVGLPLVLSEGREGGVPCGPVFKCIYTTTPPSSTGSGPFSAGSVITGYY